MDPAMWVSERFDPHYIHPTSKWLEMIIYYVVYTVYSLCLYHLYEGKHPHCSNAYIHLKIIDPLRSPIAR